MALTRLHRYPAQVEGAVAVVDEAVAGGARGVLVVVFQDDGAIEEVPCGDVTVGDLAVLAARLMVSVGT